MQGQTNQASAIERGYRTGYSDGYSAGSRDFADKAARDYRNNEDYQRGDRSYNEAWGTIEDYRDGYQQGFEAGYNAGYERRTFESNVPVGLSRRGDVGNQPATGATDDQGVGSNQGNNQSTVPNNSPNSSPNDSNAGQPSTDATTTGPISFPRNAVFLVEMRSSLSTDATQRGDQFQARVIQPTELEGAIIEGHVSRVKRAGKVKGSSEMQLAFDSLRLSDGRTIKFSADVVEIVDMGNRDSGTVDSEGGVKGKSSTKDDVSKVGAGAGVGAIIGAIFGGGKGAAIGAAIGGGVGAGTVFSKRGEDVRIERGQQLKIRTATETRFE